MSGIRRGRKGDVLVAGCGTLPGLSAAVRGPGQPYCSGTAAVLSSQPSEPPLKKMWLFEVLLDTLMFCPGFKRGYYR